MYKEKNMKKSWKYSLSIGYIVSAYKFLLIKIINYDILSAIVYYITNVL